MRIKSHTSAIKFGKSARILLVFISILVNFVSVCKICVKESKAKDSQMRKRAVFIICQLASSKAHFVMSTICIPQIVDGIYL